jgi:hypothetical protein
MLWLILLSQHRTPQHDLDDLARTSPFDHWFTGRSGVVSSVLAADWRLESHRIFWQKRMILERSEFLINRAGISIMIVGVLVRFIYHLMFAGG